ncbi:YhbD family protein [Alicyclobacillus sp.]|uniref:YhbD family protein n=1 Tax=Alicyclobacillus sp. TaxID=61169 RepID=UPI0025B9B3D1|nr:YhbD family protein [Alicyclobacillus sp.]MCL6518028.1 YhbD family protein [Alicyclobacillus sp.]
MDQDLISKKELLELTGISYGQLYRWKRKRLIPEEWFIRKSTFTGQETFFPREKILARIERIKDMKDDLSLDELADVFSPNPAGVSIRWDEVRERHIVTEVAQRVYRERHPEVRVLSFDAMLCLYVLDVALQTGEVSLDEGRMALALMEEAYAPMRGDPAGPGRAVELVFVRKLGIATCLLVALPGEIRFEPGTRVVARIHIPTCVEQLKLKLV